MQQTLDDLQKDFDEGKGVAGFWEPVPEENDHYAEADDEARTFISQPKDEEKCQNVLWGLIRPRLYAYGVTDIEEDVIRPDRADLCIEYIEGRRSPKQVFLEVKVARRRYGPARLVRPLENQLWQKYMQRRDTRHGLYVVIWAKAFDRHDWPAGYDSSSELEKALRKRAETVRRNHGVNITPHVLDVSESYRQ